MKSTQTSIFHLSEPTGLQAWVLLLVRQSDILPWWLTTGYPGFCYFKIEFMMLLRTSSQVKPGPFLTPLNEQPRWQRLQIDCFWRAHDGRSWELWVVQRTVGDSGLGVWPLSTHLNFSIFVQHTHRSDMSYWSVWTLPWLNLSSIYTNTHLSSPFFWMIKFKWTWLWFILLFYMLTYCSPDTHDKSPWSLIPTPTGYSLSGLGKRICDSSPQGEGVSLPVVFL